MNVPFCYFLRHPYVLNGLFSYSYIKLIANKLNLHIYIFIYPNVILYGNFLTCHLDLMLLAAISNMAASWLWPNPKTEMCFRYNVLWSSWVNIQKMSAETLLAYLCKVWWIQPPGYQREGKKPSAGSPIEWCREAANLYGMISCKGRYEWSLTSTAGRVCGSRTPGMSSQLQYWIQLVFISFSKQWAAARKKRFNSFIH